MELKDHKPLASGDLSSGPFVILFSSYGSPSESPVPSAGGSTPVELTAAQRVSIRPLPYNNSKVSLYFTRDEFNEVVAGFCEYNTENDGNPFLLSPEKIHLTAEWKSPSSNGRVDFLVKSVNWAIECSREGNCLEDHISRFQPGGIYYPMIKSGEFRDYILLDFRTSMPKKVRDNVLFLYFIVYSDNYATYDIYDAKLNLMDRVALLE